MVIKADMFDVWGHPPKTLTSKMTPKQLAALKQYIEQVGDKSYRLAYDNGLIEGLTTISLAISVQLKKQRLKMLRS